MRSSIQVGYEPPSLLCREDGLRHFALVSTPCHCFGVLADLALATVPTLNRGQRPNG